ncbi:MAG TPA: hypothetical protein VKZ49_12055 [Polyangiaceae bacterium]|nr:hypothetical protein [Polyangiaceae bacterium]
MTGGGMVYPGDAPITQNGHFYLFVDGKCTYYVYGRFDVQLSTPTLATHSGKLNSDEAETLARLSSLEDFDDGVYVRNLSDAPNVVFWRQDARVDLVSQGPATSGETDESALLAQRSSDLIEFMRGIYLAGSPLTGPIRLIAVEQPPDHVDPSVPRVTWPLDTPLHQVAVGYDEGAVEADESFLIENDPGLATLRSYREQVFSRIPQLLFVDSGDLTYSVHFRDALPFEDEEGFVRLE